MKWCERILLMAWLGFCFAIMTEGTLWAGDCSGPDDCGNVPDNNSRAAVGGGAVVGGGLAYRSHKKRKKKAEDPCQGERDSVQQSEDALRDLQSLIDALLQQLAQLQSQVAQQIVQLQLQAISAVGESAANPALSGVVANLQTELQLLGDPASLLTGGTNPADFFSTISSAYNVMAAQAGAAMGWAQTGPFPLTLTFLNSLSQLQGQLAMGDGLLNSVRDLQDNRLKQAQDDLQNAEEVLAECEASQRQAVV